MFIHFLGEAGLPFVKGSGRVGVILPTLFPQTWKISKRSSAFIVREHLRLAKPQPLPWLCQETQLPLISLPLISC